MRLLYTIVLYLLVPWVFVRLWWRSLQAPAYRRRWAERFGFFDAPAGEPPIWVHAVSVGEVQAAEPLVRALQKRRAGERIVVTTTTPTGSQRVKALFGDEVFHVYLPYDLPGAVRRFLAGVRPRMALIMETELWPNLFHVCRSRNIPVVVANARLSARSADGYRRAGRLARQTLGNITVVAAQTGSDAQRFRFLGVPEDAVRVTGSLKFEIHLPASLREQAEVLRRELGGDRPVWIAGSTHEGEEEPVLDAFEHLRRSIPDSLLIIVPRHPERFTRVGSACRRRGFNVVARSEHELCSAETDIYLGDTLGELPVMYGAADVAFVGGSLVPVGGHNLLEPAALGVPVVIGPHSFNFEEVTERLLEVDGARQVQDAQSLAACVETLLRDANLRYAMGQNAKAFVEHNKGARERLLAIVAEVFGEADGSTSAMFRDGAPVRE